MRIHWFFLIGALALLLPPIPFSTGFRKTLSSFRRNSLANPAGAARVWQNWVDLLRAALGVSLLMESFEIVDSRGSADYQAMAVKAAVLGLALLPQTVRVLRSVQFLAPIFYLSGLTLILGGNDHFQGMFAVGVGWLFAIGGKNLGYQLPAMGVALLVASFLFRSNPLLLMVNCGLIVLPLILSVLFRKRLIFASTVSTAG